MNKSEVSRGSSPVRETSALFETLYKKKRTIEANDNYVVAVAHDGKGNNTIYVYDTSLKLLAHKSLKIKKDDYSFNLNAYLHKLQLVMTKSKTLYIFGISQKYEYKLFVFEYDDGDLKTIKKYKNIHKSLITDLVVTDSV